MNAWKHKILTAVFGLLAFAAVAQSDNKVTVDTKNELNINTPGLEFSPTFYEDGIVFISSNKAGLKKVEDKNLDQPAFSILRSKRNPEGELMAPEPFAKALSSIYHEGPVCFDRTAETVFFSRNIIVRGKQKIAKDGLQKMRIYSATKSGDTWSEPLPLPFNNNEFDDCHPAISIDGDKLYFASNRPGGFGGMDLYVAYKVGDSWSEPVNLGADINSSGNEAWPFIHADNTIYFASDGQGGSGGFDMLYAVQEGSKWTKPVNLGAPFNTAGDDFALIVDLNKINGYYASNGQGGAGKDDIFNFHVENGNLDDYLLQNQRVPNRDLDLVVKVKEQNNGSNIADAGVRILNLENNNVIGRDEDGNLIIIKNENGQEVMRAITPDQGIEGSTNAIGRFTTNVKPGNYAIIVTKPGYQTKQVQLQIGKPGNVVEVALERASGKVNWVVSVFNTATNSPLAGGTLVLTNNNTSKKDTIVLDANGSLEYYLDTDTSYGIDIYQGGRKVGSSDVDTHGYLAGQTITQNISVSPVLPGTGITLPNIYYNFNDATLRPDARKDLKMVVALMKQYPSITVELSSHTDSRGTTEYNQDLSQRRADGVVAYLVENGISAQRLTPVGYGETRLRNHCADGVNCSEKEHAINRRTEVKVLSAPEGASVAYNNDGSVELNNGGSTTPVKPVVASGATTEYYVIAGSFLMETRAQAQLQTIRGLGYAGAEIVQFSGSPYFSVRVSSFASRKEANSLKSELMNQHKQDSFVRAVAPGQ